MGKFFIPRWEVKTFSGSSAEERPLQTTSQVSDYGDQSSCIPSEWLLWSSKHVDCNVLYPDTLCTKYKQMIPCSCHPNQDAKMMLDAKKNNQLMLLESVYLDQYTSCSPLQLVLVFLSKSSKS